MQYKFKAIIEGRVRTFAGRDLDEAMHVLRKKIEIQLDKKREIELNNIFIEELESIREEKK